MVNNQRLFLASCFALITTAFSFSISAATLKHLGVDLGFSGEQLGFINSLWFLGFPISMIIGGLVYNTFGPKKIMKLAFISHFVGAALTLFAIYNVSGSSYAVLLFSNLLLGIGCGCTEAACNPMIADTYQGDQRNKMLNRFHMWFPGGIVVGSLLSEFMTNMGLSWQSQFWLIPIPAVIYFYLFNGQIFPKSKIEESGALGANIKAMFTPMYGFIFVCMALTAITEFGPQKWTGLIMESSGAKPTLILALVTGLMAVTRFVGGPITKVLGQTGVLLIGAILSSIGIYLFSTQTGSMTYAAAVVFAMGVALFWPTMIGITASRAPLTGALGLSIIGGVGMFSTAIFQPFIGSWVDNDLAEKAAEGFTGTELELVAGQATLATMTTFPLILIVLFVILFFWLRGKKLDNASGSH